MQDSINQQSDERGNTQPVVQLDEALKEARFALDFARVNNLSAVLRPEALQSLVAFVAVRS